MRRATEMSSSHLDTTIDDASADLSILRRPIKTSMSGLNEARKAYENGTDEVRQLLANECDLIYECKVCRNVFRSLVNFISHKRIYCKNTFNSSVHFNFPNDGRSNYNQDLATIVQAEKDFISASKSSRSQEKDLCSIVERLVKREKANQMLKLSDFYEQVSSKLTQDEILKKKHVLQLDTVPDTNVAVYQTIKTDSYDSIKTEICEINDLMDNDHTVLGPDGKVLAASAGEDADSENIFECEICKDQFATQKTLKLHIETKHIPSTYVYQCPSCSKTFLQVKAVIRHLTNDHKKSMKRVRLMRDSILKRRTRIDEVQVKGPSRELSRLQTCQEKADAQNKAWLENLENIDASVSVNVCTFCGKRFDRRVVLLSHSKVCQQKNKSAEIVSLTKKAFDEGNGSLDTDSIETNAGNWPSTIIDESSNSNSIDTETYLLQTSTVNKRKRNRALKANIIDKPVDTDDDNADNEVREEVEKTVGHADAQVEIIDDGSTTTWNIIDPETKMEICTIKEIKREEATTLNKSANGEKGKEKEVCSKCKYCNKNFSNPSNLRRHITMLHIRQRKFGCLLCKEFKAFRKTDVIQHIHTIHEFAGNKASITEYISEKEDITSKFHPMQGQNRRKEKHTAVLKDDEVQVILEPDDVETSNSVPDTVSDSSNMQLTENSTNDIDKPIEEMASSSQHTSIKRKGRPKSILKRRLSQKIERSASADTNVARRPVRNRTMPVKKDFVYDLSNLLKKDAALYTFKEHHPPAEESQEKQHSAVTRPRNASPLPIINKNLQKKRRNTIQSNTGVIEPEKQNGTDRITTSGEVNKTQDSGIVSAKGAADIMATLAVNNNRAIFSKPPKLPTERPLSRTIKHKSVRTFDSIAIRNWPILKRPMRGGLKPKTNLNATVNSFRHVLKRKKKSSSVGRQLAIVNRNTSSGGDILKSNSSDTTIDIEDKTPKKIIKISTKIADKIQMKYAENVGEKLKRNETENKSIKEEGHFTKSEVFEQPKRRMTLLERLAENKTKKMKESMSTTQNILKQSNDSDENSD